MMGYRVHCIRARAQYIRLTKRTYLYTVYNIM